MIALAGQLDKEGYQPRCYIVGATDALGPAKAAASEQTQTDAVDLHATG